MENSILTVGYRPMRYGADISKRLTTMESIMLTRLEVLCYIHGYCGGTIHQYNRAYKVNFISMDDDTFRDWARRLSQRIERRPIGD